MGKLPLLLLLAMLANVSWFKRRGWKWFYQIFATIDPERFAFMNYGYAAGHEIDLDEDECAERYSYQLYHHVTEPLDLRGKQILEVGCGRGGGAFFLHKYRAPERVVGLDISDRAVRLCHQRYGPAGLEFVTGDAERLPFRSGFFDAVVNVESAFCYASRGDFYAEVRRVLCDGGCFLYADMERDKQAFLLDEGLAQQGLTVLSREKINTNVVRACDLDGVRRQEFIDSLYRFPLFRGPFYSFVAIPGSFVYRALKSGELAYLFYVARKER